MKSEMLDKAEAGQATSPSIAELCDLAASGLVRMLDPEKQIFCYIYGRTSTGMTRQGLSPRYTMMSLLGLHRYERSGRRSPVAIFPVLDALLKDTGWITNAGDLGLLLWTCAELAPERLPQVYNEFRAAQALERFSDGAQGCTMEVAWYLTGLATCCLRGHADLPGMAEQMAAARKILSATAGRPEFMAILLGAFPCESMSGGESAPLPTRSIPQSLLRACRGCSKMTMHAKWRCVLPERCAICRRQWANGRGITILRTGEL